jgi:hypothetical protein
MSFFDSKQETINIELTSYGKLLLSKGKFKPVYYAFFDDDVVYDSSYINLSESQNDIQQRIINETPVNKPQTIFTGVDKTVKQNTELYTEYEKVYNNILQENEILKLVEQQVESEKNYALCFPIGKSSFNSEYHPAWNINFISGAISSSAPYVDNTNGKSGSLQPFLKIPQLNLKDSVQDVLLIKEDGFVLPPIDYENIGFLIDEEGNTTTINIKLDQYLLEVLEKNVDDAKENFDMEVFIEEPNVLDPSSNYWRQLNFIKKPVIIKDNILLDKPEIPENIENLYKNPNFVEHYLNILIDDEIILPAKQQIKVGTYDSVIKPDSIGEDC